MPHHPSKFALPPPRRRPSAWVLPLLLCLALVPRAAGQAGVPLVTDDPSTPGDGHWEINVAWTLAQTRHAALMSTPVLDINYGLGERIQLNYQLPWLVLDPEDHGPRGGLGNSHAGVKYRFVDEKDAGFAMATFPQLAFETFTDAADRGLDIEPLQFYLPFEIGKYFGPLGVSFEFGYNYVEHGEDLWLYGVAASYPLSKKFELAAEIRDIADAEYLHHLPFFDAGFRWFLTDHTRLLASAGRAFRSGDEAPHLLMYVGIQFTF